MFCSNCGAAARGNFCSACGAALTESPREAEEVVHDWTREIRYEKLIRVPEVRDLIDRSAAMAGKTFSAEEFLALCEKAIPLGVPLGKLAPAAQAISSQLGIKTGKRRSGVFDRPPGAMLVAALRSFARRGQALRKTQQFDDGCLLEAALPSDMWSLEGELYVGVRKEAVGARVEAATKIPGQMFDWGKSKRCLDALFADLNDATDNGG